MGPEWIKLFPEEILSKIEILSLTDDQFGKLVRLWCVASRQGCVLPSNPSALAGIMRVSTKQAQKHMDWILKFFRPLEGNPSLLVSERLSTELEAFDSKRKILAVNGSLGGSKRAANAQAKAQANACGESKHLLKQKPSKCSSRVQSTEKITSPSLRSVEVCTEADQPPAVPPPLLALEPAIATLPCVGKGPKEWPVTQRQLDQWAEAFPGVGIMAEVRKMRLWLEDPGNSARRKTYRGTGGFVLRWLGKAQNQGPPSGGQRSPPTNGSCRTPDADESLRQQIKGKQWPTLERVASGASR